MSRFSFLNKHEGEEGHEHEINAELCRRAANFLNSARFYEMSFEDQEAFRKAIVAEIHDGLTFEELPEDIQEMIEEAEEYQVEAEKGAADLYDFSSLGPDKEEEEEEPEVKKGAIEYEIRKSDETKRYTLGIVYEPGVEDSQGDSADAEDIEKGCWGFMKHLQGQTSLNKMALELLEGIINTIEKGDELQIDAEALLEEVEKAEGSGLGFMHKAWPEDIGDIVECYTAPADFYIGGDLIKKGTWLMGVVWSDSYFEKVQKGEITGYSMGGRGRRVPIEE